MKNQASRVAFQVFSFLLCVNYAIPEGNLGSRDYGRRDRKIAIIGAGVGGTGVAYYLNELRRGGYEIDLYEKSDSPGGRLHTVNIFGKDYETGGSIAHPRNQYAKELVEKLNLRIKKKEPGSNFALVRDGKVVLHTSHWTVVTVFRILWRYGLGFNHLMDYVNKLIDNFCGIYGLQSEMNVYDDPGEILAAMNPLLRNLTTSRFRDKLASMGFHENLIEELVQAVTFVNYGQDTNVHAFVGMISVAGADDGLWSVENGNKELAIKMAQASSNTQLLLNSTVESIVDLNNRSYALRITSPSENLIKAYDTVIIASPLETSQIKFENFSQIPYDTHAKRYHRTVSTIVAGILQQNFTMNLFNVDAVFNCDRNNFYTSIGRIYPVDGSGLEDDDNDTSVDSYPVYKIFSRQPLTESQLGIVFSKIAKIHVSDWLAYPEYERVPETFSPFMLAPNLYYVNAIEWAASAIEMSLISAKNIAIILNKEMQGGHVNMGSGQQLPRGDRTEL